MLPFNWSKTAVRGVSGSCHHRELSAATGTVLVTYGGKEAVPHIYKGLPPPFLSSNYLYFTPFMTSLNSFVEKK